MNERIKELAEQAGFYSSEYGNAEESFIKFAELIVRECAELCAFNDPEQAEILLNHFGVE